MASTYREQTLMARNSAVKILEQTSCGSTLLAVAAVVAANGPQHRQLLVGSSYSTCTTGVEVVVKLDDDDKIGFLVGWVCTQDDAPVGQTMTVKKGSGRGAWRRDLGAFTHTLCTAAHSTWTVAKKWIMGPFEGARFAQYATSTDWGGKSGAQYVEFKITTTSSGGVQSAKVAIMPFRWPDVKYDT